MQRSASGPSLAADSLRHKRRKFPQTPDVQTGFQSSESNPRGSLLRSRAASGDRSRTESRTLPFVYLFFSGIVIGISRTLWKASLPPSRVGSWTSGDYFSLLFITFRDLNLNP